MRIFRFIFTTYFLLVFLSSTCAKNRARFKSKKNTWRLRLLRKLSKLYPDVELLSLKNKHNTYSPNNYNGSINGGASSGKHVPVIRKFVFFFILHCIILAVLQAHSYLLIMFGKIKSGSWKYSNSNNSNSTYSSIMK